MQTIVGRVLAFAGAIAGAAAGARAATLPAHHVAAAAAMAATAGLAGAACRDELFGRVASRSSNGIVHRATVVVTHAGDRCTLEGPPTVFASRAGAAMPVGYLSVPQSATIGGSATAAFEVRYVSGSGRSAACDLTFSFAGIPLRMRAFAMHRCERPSEIDVSSVAPGDTPPAEATAPDRSALANVPLCRASDFASRPVDSLATPPFQLDRYALQNRGAIACRTGGAFEVRFLDRAGVAVDEHLTLKTDMPLDLVVPRGREVSFTLRYASEGDPCPAAATLAVAFSASGGSAAVPLRQPPCRSESDPVDVSDLVLGVPIAAE